ncbi:MAG: DUF4258 domain-containing protein [Acidimicrobiia bacterium]|nr:DUF4258 domain-containing protein [Acidimicrobiia bacterium]
MRDSSARSEVGCLGEGLDFTDHARRRINERRITLAHVESALRSCRRHDAGDHGNVVHVGSAAGRTISVVTAPRGPDRRVILVVTAMWS